jgi:pimeloyl-ACP methyl ester carboxylesterase
VAQLADQLGLEHFGVMGHSVGAGYAAACADALPERVTAVALVSPIVPLDRPGAVDELGKAAQWRMARDYPGALRAVLWALFLLARFSPSLSRRLFGARSTASEREISSRPEVVERALASAQEAFRRGAGGLVDDMRVVMRPWGFDPADIRIPLFVWQGDEDSSIRGSWGEWWARAVPGARLTRCPGEGHLLIEERIGEILEALCREGAPAR